MIDTDNEYPFYWEEKTKQQKTSLILSMLCFGLVGAFWWWVTK